MRKHDVRKWLHAVLDLLPLILIPVFMIYSHRHTIDSGSIDVPQNQVVDFNQLVYNGNFKNTEHWNLYNIDSFSVSDNVGTFIANNTDGAIEHLFPLDSISYNNNVYLLKCSLRLSSLNTSGFVRFRVNNYLDTPFINSLDWVDYEIRITANADYNGTYVSFVDNSDDFLPISVRNVQVFDLTTIFGSGNEPTTQQFNTWFNAQYYSYTLSSKQLIKDVSTITYDDTDIMSQVVYQLYNSVDKYFNMGNVFNMTGVYDWFNLNIFNGNAPISIYIVWNIVLYEFVMDLLFLLYGLFMWFIDMVEKLMEKPLKSVK